MGCAETADLDDRFDRGFAAYFVSRRMGGWFFVRLKPHAPSEAIVVSHPSPEISEGWGNR